jgi:hypothetical protein
VFDQPLLFTGETLELKPALHERLIANHRVQLQPPAEVRQVKLEIYGIARVKFSGKYEAEAALTQGY